MPFSEETHDAAAAARLRMEKENILQQLLIFFLSLASYFSVGVVGA